MQLINCLVSLHIDAHHIAILLRRICNMSHRTQTHAKRVTFIRVQHIHSLAAFILSPKLARSPHRSNENKLRSERKTNASARLPRQRPTKRSHIQCSPPQAFQTNKTRPHRSSECGRQQSEHSSLFSRVLSLNVNASLWLYVPCAPLSIVLNW